MKIATKIVLLGSALLITACANQPAKQQQSSESDLASKFAAIMGEPTKVDPKTLEQYPLGSAKNPIRSNGPRGQREYLSRLVCSNNEPVSAYQRLGSVGESPYGYIMDVYEVICDTGKGVVKHEIYLDMYHGDYIESRPAAGFIALQPIRK